MAISTDEPRLVIIGNGFDLSCGLKSSFKDFLNRDEKSKKLLSDVEETYSKLKIFHKSCEELGSSVPFMKASYFQPISEVFEKVEQLKIHNELNLWELLLIINKQINSNWCDVEGTITNFFTIPQGGQSEFQRLTSFCEMIKPEDWVNIIVQPSVQTIMLSAYMGQNISEEKLIQDLNPRFTIKLATIVSTQTK